VLEGDRLYQQNILWYEDRLVAALRARAGRPSGRDATQIDRAVSAIVTTSTPAPSTEQTEAVRFALGRRLAAIAGGPGTGKTTVALTLVRALARLGVAPTAIALAAPTGKAANRLEESILLGLARAPARSSEDEALSDALPGAQTLHRLLGYSPHSGRFNHHGNNRLAHAAVVIDESSMIDLFIMERLLAALRDDACLILLGDADQLPSVGTGVVFKDLADRKRGPASVSIRLTQSHRVDPARRAGSRILEVAARVRAGDAAGAATSMAARESLADAQAHIDADGVALIAPTNPGNSPALAGFLDAWHRMRVATHPAPADLRGATLALSQGVFSPTDLDRLRAAYAHHRAHRLLCVTRGRPTGAAAANARLHACFAMGAGGDPNGVTAGIEPTGATAAFLPGEPIMMGRNDYDRGLWNGDQGLVARVSEAGRTPRLMAVFPGAGENAFSAWDIENLGDAIELAFALTVHKAQGSEFDDVALILPEAPVPLLTRELLYTALTRSRRAVFVYGGADVFAAGVARPLSRVSGVAAKLSAFSG
jgi:exodeoxyribonuclease V alpha subunit